MFNMTLYVELQRLLDMVGEAEAKLSPREIETYLEVKAKYAEPTSPEATDITCLEVILRNIEIRKGFGVDPKRDTTRVIELERTKKRPN